jgi:hypothetical protein
MGLSLNIGTLAGMLRSRCVHVVVLFQRDEANRAFPDDHRWLPGKYFASHHMSSFQQLLTRVNRLNQGTDPSKM